MREGKKAQRCLSEAAIPLACANGLELSGEIELSTHLELTRIISILLTLDGRTFVQMDV